MLFDLRKATVSTWTMFNLMRSNLNGRSGADQSSACLSDLPVELQRRIIIEFLKDPNTNFDELKVLRLVCRKFNAVVVPFVLSCICPFRDETDLLGNLCQLGALLSPKPRQHLYVTETLVLKEWIWIYGVNRHFSYRDLPIGSFVLLNSLLALLLLVSLPYTLPLVTFKTGIRLNARFLLSGDSRINLPNIRRVVWTVYRQDPKWLLRRTAKLLIRTTQLNELVLVIDERSRKLDYLVDCLAELGSLRKLEVDFRFRKDKLDSPRNYDIHKFGKLIAANPNLTHLRLKNSGTGDNANLSLMLRYIPADRPLKLEHLSISGLFFGEEAIVPHIQSLISFHFSHGTYLRVLLSAGIFPPVMSMDYISPDSMEYFNLHPRITGLSLKRGCQGVPIFEIMARHAATLTHLSVYSWSFYFSFEQLQNETYFLKCTKLEELVLHYYPKDPLFQVHVTPEMDKALSVIARLPQPLTVVITAFDVFKCCVKHCHQSRNRLVRDLGNRIVLQK
ncbi:hypothetical protein APHAL10511_005394 [Amanita phalloides]|nr:hypothetical protein APHAL10511_005394 [Amanita phalloides]